MSALLVFLLLVGGFIVVGNVLSGRRPRDHVYSFPIDETPSLDGGGTGGDDSFDFSSDGSGSDGGGGDSGGSSD